MCACVSCKKEETQTEGTTEAITNGSVEDSSAFIPLGMVIDVSQNDMIKDVTYEIKDTEIAVVNFKYNGLQCQFRGSAVHNEFDLAGVQNNGDGNMVVTSVGSYNATYYKLDPGRVVFWSDENIHYSLYVYVTAEDSVLEEILSNLIFENHYTERADVKKSTEAAAEEKETSETPEAEEKESAEETPEKKSKFFKKDKKDKKDAEIEELKDRLVRQMAEFDNYR